jgi:hypothetical protein
MVRNLFISLECGKKIKKLVYPVDWKELYEISEP